MAGTGSGVTTDEAPTQRALLERLFQAALGPRATLGRLRFEGRRMDVTGTRLPLYPGAWIDVAHAVVELCAGPPLGPLPLAARLLSFRGALHAPDRILPFDFHTASASHDPSWAHGTLRAGALPLHLTLAPAPGGHIAVTLAVITARSRLTLTGTVDPATRLHDVRIAGHLASADALAAFPDLSPRPVALLDVDLTAEGTLTDPKIHGRIAAASILLPPLHLEHVTATLALDRRGLAYRDLTGTARGARFTAWGHLPFPASHDPATGPLLALQIERAGPSLLAALATLAALPSTPPLPPALTLSGEILVSPDRSTTGAFAIATTRSTLFLKLSLDAAGALLGSTLRGSLAAADALAMGLAPTEPLSLGPSTHFSLDLHLTGTLARPGIAGRVTTPSATFHAGDALTLILDDVAVLLDADPDRVAWQRLVARFYGGTLSSSGRIAIGRGGAALLADVAWRGVRVQDLPTGPLGEHALGALLRGVSAGEFHFEHRALADRGPSLAARGRVTVARPAYRFARTLTPTLARYGLPPLRTRGEGPLVAAVRLDGDAIHVDPVTAAVPAADVEGTLQLHLDGRLLGRVHVHLHERYLAGSPILAVPAALMGKVTIPVDLAGTLDAPELRTDALAILDGLLARRGRPGVGDAVRGVLDSLRSVADGYRRPRRP